MIFFLTKDEGADFQLFLKIHPESGDFDLFRRPARGHRPAKEKCLESIMEFFR